MWNARGQELIELQHVGSRAEEAWLDDREKFPRVTPAEPRLAWGLEELLSWLADQQVWAKRGTRLPSDHDRQSRYYGIEQDPRGSENG